MRIRRKLFIFYIYLSQKFIYFIKTGEINKEGITNKKEHKARQKGWFWSLALRAFLTTFLVFFTIVYLHQGSLIFNADGSTIFNRMALFELSATFVFLFGIFVVHRGISSLMHSNRFQNLNSLVKRIVEAFMVVVSSVFFLFLFVLIPFFLVFPQIEVSPDKIRFNYIFIAIITLFFYYFVERERSKKQLQAEMLRSARLQKENFQAQLENLKDQVNPHFLFNSLNVLVSLIPQDAERATEFTRKLSELYRSFLDNSAEQLIPLQKELEIIEAYIYLLKTRFGESVQFEMQIASEVKELQLPPGSLQVLVENAIKHNGSTRKKPLLIQIFSEEDLLVVKNNLQPRLERIESTNTGLKNIESRYSFLSDKKPVFTKTQSHFLAKLPLLKVENP